MLLLAGEYRNFQTMRVPKVTLPIQPPPKPLDHQDYNYKQQTPQEPNSLPQRKFHHLINASHSSIICTHNSQNVTWLQTSTLQEQQKHINQAMAHASQHKPKQYSTLLEEDNLQPSLNQNKEKQLEQQGHSTSHPDFMVASDSMLLWIKMQDHYASTLKWKLNNEPTTPEHGSPLIWTMLHPSADTWNQTYTWYQPLDEYMPWTACQILSTKPILISCAMWNMQRQLDLATATVTKTWPILLLHVIKQEKQLAPLATRQCPRAPTRQRCLVIKLAKGDVTTPTALQNSPSYGSSAHFTSPTMTVEPRFSVAPSTTIYSVIADFLFPYQPSTHGGPRIDTQNPIPLNAQSPHWTQHHPWSARKTPIMAQKSYLRWIASIIQLQWNMAWDLLTHWNVELLYIWSWPTQNISG